MTAQPLPREEYIEQAYFFRVYRERLQNNVPSQEILKTIQEEILSTTNLPKAIDFMRAEILHMGRIGDAMARLSHYFTPFQAFVINRAEDDVSRFDQVTGLEILEREAQYRALPATQAGLFVYQFECIARNRLGYGDGLTAMSKDVVYDETWRRWIQKLRLRLGTRELSEIVYRASQHFQDRRRSQHGGVEPEDTSRDASAETTAMPVLFGEQEGRIARANIGRDPLYLFAALQRQLNYPAVPRPDQESEPEKLPGFLEARLQKIEQPPETAGNGTERRHRSVAILSATGKRPSTIPRRPGHQNVGPRPANPAAASPTWLRVLRVCVVLPDRYGCVGRGLTLRRRSGIRGGEWGDRGFRISEPAAM
ncbi:MAG: hypothetical protein R3C19_09990 [Planctomycetaceae bacterium]